MSADLSSHVVAQRTYQLLRGAPSVVASFAAAFFAVFFVANLARGFFPAAYTFRPVDQWALLIPEAIILGPLLALFHHRLLGDEEDFAWSRSSRTVKFIKAIVYFYVLLIVFKLGIFAATEVVPALLGYVFGSAVAPFIPIVVMAGVGCFIYLYVRPLLAFCVLSGQERQPIMTSVALTKGKSRRIVACLLIPAAPVIIAWVGAATYAPHLMEFSDAGSPRFAPIILAALMQTAGAVLIPPGLCAIYEILDAEAKAKRDEAVIGYGLQVPDEQNERKNAQDDAQDKDTQDKDT